MFIGFDEPTPLGRHETGSSVAAPVFKDFMEIALKDQPAIPFRTPPGIRLVRIDARTGEPARPGDKDVILEAYKDGTSPTAQAGVIEGQGWSDTASDPAFSGTPVDGDRRALLTGACVGHAPVTPHTRTQQQVLSAARRGAKRAQHNLREFRCVPNFNPWPTRSSSPQDC